MTAPWQFDPEFRTWTIRGRNCYVWMDERPAYCDRGRWLARLEVTNGLALSIDYADGWPRYYFDRERAMLEIEAWLRNRKEWIEP